MNEEKSQSAFADVELLAKAIDSYQKEARAYLASNQELTDKVKRIEQDVAKALEQSATLQSQLDMSIADEVGIALHELAERVRAGVPELPAFSDETLISELPK